jgi:hypothetical protein
MALGSSALVTASNKVRIGNASVTVIEGQVAYSFPSDGRFKTNIKEDVPGLAFINKLRPVTYKFETEKFDEFVHQDDPSFKHRENTPDYAASSQITQSGFIAQEVEKAMQQTGYNFNGIHHPQSKADNYSMSYELMVVPLVKAVQELSKENDELNLKVIQFENLKMENEKLKTRLELIEQKLGISSDQISSVALTDARLEQNIPNPFNKTTTINYTLPQQYSSAKIIVTDKSGKVLKEVSLSAKGSGGLNINASTLSAGAYQYSLYVDGGLIATKQMVLAK